MKTKLYILVPLLIGVCALLVTGCSAGDSTLEDALAPMTQIDDHEITFLSRTYDPGENVSRWTYEVSSGEGPSISHWVIEWCGDCADLVDASEDYECSEDPHQPMKLLPGIKFNDGYGDGVSREVWFELEGDYPEGSVGVAIKAGQNELLGQVTGPVCEQVEPDLTAVGNFVWHDLNQDGIQDADEPGLEGVTVRLYRCDDTFVAETTTGGDGHYLFTNLMPGDYKVEFVLLEGYAFSPQDADGEGIEGEVNSDADPDTGMTGCVTLEAGDSKLFVDAGMYQPSASIKLEKSATPETYTAAGQEITYTFVVTNDGDVTLTGVTIDDPMFVGDDAPVFVSSTMGSSEGSLLPAESATYEATYTITQDDLDEGSVENEATATGNDPDGNPVTDDDDDTVTADQDASIDLDKSADPQTYSAVGNEITYTFTVTNDGNVTLTGVTVTDPLDGLSAITYVPGSSTEGSLEGTLLPSESATYTATYTVTQADIDAGKVENTATATGTDPYDNPVTHTDDEIVDGPDAAPAIDLDKSASPTSYSAVGNEITYTFVVTNDGNVTLTGVTVTDPLDGLSAITYVPGSSTEGSLEGTLLPSESATYQATYTITQDDLDEGSVENEATATGNDPDGNPVTDDDDDTVTADQDASIDLDKSADPQTYSAVGDEITYTFTVTNDGNVTLTGVTVTDPLDGLSAIAYVPGSSTEASSEGILLPGESATYEATYTITQDDVAAAEIENTATATGTPPIGEDVTATDDETVTLTQTPDISIVKSSEWTTGDGSAVGHVVTYTFTVKNEGNVTLDPVTVVDDMFGTITLSSSSLGPGETTTGTYELTLTQELLDAGSHYNEAIATGTAPTGDDVTDTDDETVTFIQEPSISLEKSADPQTYSAVGNEITYTFTVTNDGNVTLTGVTVTDPLDGLSAITYVPGSSTEGSSEGILLPGESATYEATYTITQDDVAAGEIENTATATGTPPTGDDVTDTDDETVTFIQEPSISLEKSADPQTYSAVGNEITYAFTVTNDGNVTVSDVKIDDPTLDIAGVAVTPSTLVPGQTGTREVTYTVTEDDVDTGSIYNEATATGTAPDESTVTDTDDETVTYETASIHLDKSADPETCMAAGQEITYTFVVTNDGDVTLTGVTIDDPMFSGADAPAFVSSTMDSSEGTLLPAESATYTATCEVTEADIEAGQVENTATATGTPPAGPDVSDTDTATVSVVECMCICGFVYEYGTMQSLAGWEVILEKKGSPWVYVDSTLTDEDGKYCFCACEVGEYRIREVVQPGWTQVSPQPNEHIWLVPQDGGSDPEDGPFFNFANKQSSQSQSPSNPHTVGWEASPVDRLAVLLPWVALFAAIIAGAGLLVLRRRGV